MQKCSQRLLKMEQRPLPFLMIFMLYCVCIGPFSSGFPQPFAGYLAESDIPKSEIPSSVMDLYNSMFNSLQIDEERNQEIYKRFLFHYSRAQVPTYPLKAGSFPVHALMSLAPKLSERRMERFLNPEPQITTEEFTKKDDLAALGRPFFLFRPRNGRTVDKASE